MRVKSNTNVKRRLLFINGSLNVGGIEKSLLCLLENLDYSQYEVDLLLLDDTGVYANQLPHQVRLIYRDNSHIWGPLFPTIIDNLLHLRVKDVVFRLVILFFPKLGNWLLKVLRPILKLHKKYDCAIAYRPGLPYSIVAYTVRAKKKFCWWHHGICVFNENTIQSTRNTLGEMDSVITVSEGCRKMITECFALKKTAVHVIPNIVDVESIHEKAGTTNPYKSENLLNIVTLGRLCWEKHIEDVPEIAYSLIQKGITNFRWYIIGNGAKYEDVASCIQKYHLEKQVIMLGQLSNPYPYLKYADLLFNSSYYESQCLAVLEAMVLKTPCVITKTTIPLDYPVDGVNCLLAEQNIQSQAECLIRMMTGKVDTEMLTENAYKMVVKEYSKSNIIPRIDQLIR